MTWNHELGDWNTVDGGHAINLLGKGEKKDNHYAVITIVMPGAFPLF